VQHITLPILDETGTQVVSQEVLEVERESDGHIRLTHSPAFVSGIARGDLIALDASPLSGFSIVERGGMVAAVVSFATVDQKHGAEPQLSADVQALGGVCEGGPGGALVFSVPASVGFPKIEGFSTARPAAFRGGLVLRECLGCRSATAELVVGARTLISCRAHGR
jgi:Domain of unknown function (DUF4265)